MGSLVLTGMPFPEPGEHWVSGYLRIDPADAASHGWADGVYMNAWPIEGHLNALGDGWASLPNGTESVIVPGTEVGEGAVAGPKVRISYQLVSSTGDVKWAEWETTLHATTAGVYNMRALPKNARFVDNPGTPPTGLFEPDIGVTVASQQSLNAVQSQVADVRSALEFQTVAEMQAVPAARLTSGRATAVVRGRGMFTFGTRDFEADTAWHYRSLLFSTGAWKSEHDGAVSVRWEGAKATASTTANRAAFQKTIDDVHGYGDAGKHRIFVPGVNVRSGESYKVLLPIFLRDGITIEGEGDASRIENVRGPNANGRVPSADSTVFRIGQMFPHWFTNPDFRNVQNVLAQRRQVVFSNPADADGFNVGDLVFVRSGSLGYVHVNAACNSGFKPHVAFVDRIIGKSGNTITLKHPFLEPLVGGQVARVGAWVGAAPSWQGQEGYVVRNVKLRDLSLSSRGTVMGQTAFYECEFTNIESVSSRNGAFGNAMNQSTFRDCKFSFNNKAGEAATYSRGMRFLNCDFRYVSEAEQVDLDDTGQEEAASERVMLKSGENATFVDYINCNFDGGIGAFTSIINLSGTRNTRILDCHFRATSAVVSAIDLRPYTGSPPGSCSIAPEFAHVTLPPGFTSGNQVIGCTFEIDGANHHIRIADAPLGALDGVTNNIIRGNVFKGKAVLQGGVGNAIYLAGSGNVIEDNVWEDRVTGGLVSASNIACGTNIFQRNAVQGFNSAANQLAQLANNVIRENRTPRSERRALIQRLETPDMNISLTVEQSLFRAIPLPADTFASGNQAEVSVIGEIAAGAGAGQKFLRFMLGATQLLLVTLPDGFTGRFKTSFILNIQGDTTIRISGETLQGAIIVPHTNRFTTLPSLSTTPLNFEIRAWAAQTSLRIAGWSFTTRTPYLIA